MAIAGDDVGMAAMMLVPIVVRGMEAAAAVAVG